MALALADVTEGARWGNRTYFRGKKGFAWERPLSKADVKRWTDGAPPEGPLLALLTSDLLEKEAALESHPKAFFTIEHFKNYPAYLVRLNEVTKKVVEVALRDAYRAAAAAPKSAKRATSTRPRAPAPKKRRSGSAA